MKDSTFVCISEMSEGKIEQEDGGHLQNIYFAGGVDDESLQLVFSEVMLPLALYYCCFINSFSLLGV